MFSFGRIVSSVLPIDGFLPPNHLLLHKGPTWDQPFGTISSSFICPKVDLHDIERPISSPQSGGLEAHKTGWHKCDLKMKRRQSKDLLQLNLAGKVLTSGARSVYFQSDKVARCIYVTAAVYTFDWTQPCELIAPVYNSHSKWWSGEAKGPLHWMRVAFKQLWKLQPFCSDSS